MIITASLAAEKRKSAEVEIEDIKRVYKLFVDVKRSTQYLVEFNKEFMFNELGDEEETEQAAAEEDDDGAANEKKGDTAAMETSP